MPKPNGYILYEGPSRANGDPIVVIATGFTRASKNTKTGGGTLQTFIMPQNVDPRHAIRTGDDECVCFNCKHRPFLGGKCYVNVYQAPLQVWKAYKRGSYPKLKDHEYRLFSGRTTRMGTWGDPAAAPLRIWKKVARHSAKWLGYTHQYRRFPGLKPLVMASADNQEEAGWARERGWRHFRTVSAEDHRKFGIMDREILCPASAEAGKIRTCETCNACRGGGMGEMSPKAASVFIPLHGFRFGKPKPNGIGMNV